MWELTHLVMVRSMAREQRAREAISHGRDPLFGDVDLPAGDAWDDFDSPRLADPAAEFEFLDAEPRRRFRHDLPTVEADFYEDDPI